MDGYCVGISFAYLMVVKVGNHVTERSFLASIDVSMGRDMQTASTYRRVRILILLCVLFAWRGSDVVSLPDSRIAIMAEVLLR